MDKRLAMNDLNTVSDDIEHILLQIADMPPGDEESHIDLVAPLDERSECHLIATGDENCISCYITNNDSTLTDDDMLEFHENLLRMTCEERFTSGFIGALDENNHEVIAKNVNASMSAFELGNTLENILNKLKSQARGALSPTAQESRSFDAFSESTIRV
jgi:hypothetical protein